MKGQIRLTEQGEVISAKYGNAAVGRGNLETLVAATLEATFLTGEAGPPPAFLAVMDELSETSRRAYRDLVYESAGFADFFFEATPISEITQLNIGSRPASRKANRRIEDLRAIPWSFSWSQSRINLPGWYGFGTAVEAFLAGGDRDERVATLMAMREGWPFFRALISNMEMVIAKADLGIARRYAGLVRDEALAARVFAAVEAEWGRANAALDLVLGGAGRLADNPALARSIARRAAYIAPLNHLQVELLGRWRAGETDDKARRGILISINGVAAGLRNSG